jgi:hypothetical protein
VNAASAARSAFLALPDSIQRQVLHRTGRFAPWERGAAPEAPACPVGMSVGPPDFVGVGVPKAGTTWWFSLILAHPDVHGPEKKELLFFNRNFFERYRRQGCTDEDLRAYHNWFPRPPQKKTGEWTPSYLFSYLLPPLLRRATPDGKVLVMLRDPVDRYRSDISRTMPRRRLRNVRYKGLARGFYAAELAPWEQVYQPSQMLVLQYEACTLSPAEQLAATYRFLDLDDSFRPPGIQAAVNKTKAKRTVDVSFERLLVDLYEPDVAALAGRHPQIDLTLWRHFTHLAT